MQKTTIQWTDYSLNALKYRDASRKSVWGCVKVSEGCKNCYSETSAKRWKRGGPFSLAQMKTLTPYFNETEAANVLRSKEIAGKRIFVSDMSDLFGEWVPDEIIDKHFSLFALRPDVTFQLLTKRPERMAAYLTSFYPEGGRLEAMLGSMQVSGESPFDHATDDDVKRLSEIDVLPNVWLGCSCENQAAADERIPHLLRCPAVVRFLSVEPMIGPVTLPEEFLQRLHISDDGPKGTRWVIIGGESGPKARPFDLAWARSIRDQCKAAGVPFFMKQDAGPKPGMRGRIPDDLWIQEFPESAKA